MLTVRGADTGILAVSPTPIFSRRHRFSLLVSGDERRNDLGSRARTTESRPASMTPSSTRLLCRTAPIESWAVTHHRSTWPNWRREMQEVHGPDRAGVVPGEFEAVFRVTFASDAAVTAQQVFEDAPRHVPEQRLQGRQADRRTRDMMQEAENLHQRKVRGTICSWAAARGQEMPWAASCSAYATAFRRVFTSAIRRARCACSRRERREDGGQHCAVLRARQTSGDASSEEGFDGEGGSNALFHQLSQPPSVRQLDFASACR
jgi:hypothetical protein